MGNRTKTPRKEIGMKGLWICILLLCLGYGINAPASTLEPNKNGLVRQGSCFGQFSDYDAWMDFLREKNGYIKTFLLSFQFSREVYDQAKNQLDCHFISYTSDGLSISGYMVIPKNLEQQKIPVIIYNRGGNQRFGAITFAHLFNYIFPLSNKGYMVLASQYRGSVNAPSEGELGSDQFGGDDVNDVVALLDLLETLPRADTENVFMVGQSRGAMMALMTLKRNNNLNALATIAGEFDLQGGLEFRPEMEQVYQALIPNYQDNKTEALRQRSALYWAEQLPPSTEILILHGEDDEKVSVQSAYKFDQRLTQLGREHKMVIYSGDNHFLGSNRDSAIAEIDQWFKHHTHRQQANEKSIEQSQ